MFFSQLPAHLAKAEELKQPPPKGVPFSVGIPGTEQSGRSRVYRAWNYQKELLKTLDPQVCVYLGLRISRKSILLTRSFVFRL